MKPIRIQIDYGYELKFDNSCVSAFWDMQSLIKPMFYDPVFEEFWKKHWAEMYEEVCDLNEPMFYYDEDGNVKEYNLSAWDQFWSEFEAPNFILIEELTSASDSGNDNDEFYYSCYYLINKNTASVFLNEEFKENEEWIKEKFLLKSES